MTIDSAVYTNGVKSCDILLSSEDLLKDPVLPLAEKCRKKVEAMFHKEESCR